jgi:hypothetical protein
MARGNGFIRFLIKGMIYGLIVISVVVGINYFVDASSSIRSEYAEMAKLALDGNIVAVPENYNHRVYQMTIVDEMTEIPETVVIGSSRGMYLGTEITGYDNLYNNCVSGAAVEDNYALLGLYYNKFGVLPKRVIIETSPWVLYEDNPESRWNDLGTYTDCAQILYELVNNEPLETNISSSENPYVSISYFQYNFKQLCSKGLSVFKKNDARVSTDVDEAADYPDGTIRYAASKENESEERLQAVQRTTGAWTYENSDKMTEISENKKRDYENLIDYLLESGSEVIIFLQPFSVTQCEYSLDQNLNPAYKLVREYLYAFAEEKGIEIKGDYDARKYNLTDVRFIDAMHLDKKGINIVWNYTEGF